MCGIAGLLTRRPRDDLRGLLEAMASSIRHRGPDDEGYLQAITRDGAYQIGLAHRRLSIIDLDGGHQPLANEDASVHVVFNGEIYNYRDLRRSLIAKGHRFRSDSDTETIVHAYEEFGEACVERLDGMFAFAVWDARRERLFLARDRFGKKPLYLRRDGDCLLFGSEIKALLCHPELQVAVDAAAVADYLLYRYVPGPRTLFEGIHKLPPGTWLSWERGGIREHRFYRPPDGAPHDGAVPAADPVSGFLDRLERAVQARMVSDVPFGAFLSGGIDSAAVVALMSRHSSRAVQTFSVGFSEAGYSELDHARAVADRVGAEHRELVVSERDLMTGLPDLIGFRDAPVSEPSDIPIHLLSRAASDSVKMVLTGEGGDEVLGGYPKHLAERHLRAYHRLPRCVRRGVIEPLVSALPYRYRRVKILVHNAGIESWEARMPAWFGAHTAREHAQLCAIPRVAAPGDGAPPFDTGSENSPLRRVLYFDQTSWLPDNLLERGDRMTMASSLEARMPFLDHQLVAYVSALPDRFRLRGLTTKWILRRALERILPRSILERPKVGFRVPVHQWFRGPMRDYLLEHVSGSGMATRHFYRQDLLDRAVHEHLSGRRNHEKLLWTILNLELWHRRYVGTG